MFSRIALVGLFFLTTFTAAHSGPNDDPTSGQVCNLLPGQEQQISTVPLVQFYLHENGVREVNLKIKPNDTLQLRDYQKAIMDPVGFCSNGRCPDTIVQQLTDARGSLIRFLAETNRSNPGKNKDRVYVTSTIDPAEQTRLLVDFLYNRGNVRAYCVAAVKEVPTPVDPTTQKYREIKNDLRIRKSVADLHVEDVAGAQFATFALNSNRVVKRTIINSEVMVGIPISIVPSYTSEYYAFLTHKSARGSGVNPDLDTGDVGVGFSADTLLGYHHLQFYTHYISSYKTSAEIISANVLFSPALPIRGVGIVEPINDSLSYLLRPQLKLVYGDIMDPGTSVLLQQQEDFLRAGGRVSLWLYGEGKLNRFSVNVAYEYLTVMQGPLDRVSRFESSINYKLDENFALALTYINGRDLDTLVRQEMVTVGLNYRR